MSQDSIVGQILHIRELELENWSKFLKCLNNFTHENLKGSGASNNHHEHHSQAWIWTKVSSFWGGGVGGCQQFYQFFWWLPLHMDNCCVPSTSFFIYFIIYFKNAVLAALTGVDEMSIEQHWLIIFRFVSVRAIDDRVFLPNYKVWQVLLGMSKVKGEFR